MVAPSLPHRLIPRHVVFCDPNRTHVTLSHDGRRLAWLENRDGAPNLIVSPVHDLNSAKQITHETRCSILPLLVWAHSDRHVVIFRDREGDENYRAFSVNVDTGAETSLTPGDGVRSLYWGHSVAAPTELLFGLNRRDRRYFDLVRVDVTTGVSKSVFENPGFSRLHVDRSFMVRFAERVRADGSAEILELQPGGRCIMFVEIPADDVLTTRFERMSADGCSVFLVDSRGRDKAALVEIDVASRYTTVLAEDPDADISTVVYHPDTGRPLAATAVALRQRWHPIDHTFRSDLECLVTEAGDAEFSITDICTGMDRIVTFLERSDTAGEFRLYERSRRTAVLLFKNRTDLEDASLQPMRAVTIVASDGLNMPSYLTLPDDKFRCGPMVLVVHGGPYARDAWGFSAWHQWLASRGYAVLSINFRGSTGFGKAFTNAANQEWGGRMQDDLTDGVIWAIEQGYADPARIGFFGVSYGGYAALMAAARTPETFACFIDVCGPSNLITFMNAIPPYWHSWFAMIRSRLADPATEEGVAWLAQRSPLNHVDRIARPLLIAQGLQDVRVTPQESHQIVEVLQRRGVPVTFVTFCDEGHFFVRQQNRIAFSAVMEVFLARHLGGAFEPVEDAFIGSSICIETGKECLEDFGSASIKYKTTTN